VEGREADIYVAGTPRKNSEDTKLPIMGVRRALFAIVYVIA